jgi:hypothetical protein
VSQRTRLPAQDGAAKNDLECQLVTSAPRNGAAPKVRFNYVTSFGYGCSTTANARNFKCRRIILCVIFVHLWPVLYKSFGVAWEDCG